MPEGVNWLLRSELEGYRPILDLYEEPAGGMRFVKQVQPGLGANALVRG